MDLTKILRKLQNIHITVLRCNHLVLLKFDEISKLT